jgi:hypothetical protein
MDLGKKENVSNKKGKDTLSGLSCNKEMSEVEQCKR